MALYIKAIPFAIRSKQYIIIRFVVISFVLYFLWLLCYDKVAEFINPWLTMLTAKGSSGLVNMLGFKAYLKGTTLNVSNFDVVFIDTPCNGLILFAQFAVFIIAFPGPVGKKFWYIPMGILVIYFLNLIRIAALALISIYDYKSLNFDHHFLFNIIAYSVIFTMWFFWFNKLSFRQN